MIFQNMPIRIRMSLFYSLLTLVLLAVFFPTLYFGTEKILMSDQEQMLRLSLAQLVERVESEDGELVLEDGAGLPQGAGYAIHAEDGTLIAQSRMPGWIAETPFVSEKMQTVAHDGGVWLLIDGTAQEDDTRFTVRVCFSLEPVRQTMSTIRTVCFITTPVLLLLAFLGGHTIARRSLRPIEGIIGAVRVIATGDLSERVQNISSKDEVGDLARTMNDMLEKIEASFARERRFASDASHELRTPVSIVMAYAEGLLEGRQPEDEETKGLETILAESRHMERIIAQLLMITRGQEKRYPVHMEKLDLREILESVVEQLSPLAREREITLVIETAAGTSIEGDQSLLTQMMMNLLENGIKYGRRGGHVVLSAHVVKGACEIAVRDDGIGIAAESLPHIFDRFYRADTVRDRSGTGLGLSIVRWIVEAHGGEIQANSTPGKGTEIRVRLHVKP